MRTTWIIECRLAGDSYFDCNDDLVAGVGFLEQAMKVMMLLRTMMRGG